MRLYTDENTILPCLPALQALCRLQRCCVVLQYDGKANYILTG